jgi:hypothetical protein
MRRDIWAVNHHGSTARICGTSTIRPETIGAGPTSMAE